MAKRPTRHSDDPRPGSGFRLELADGTVLYLAPDEKSGVAQVAQAQQLLGASPEEISQAVLKWLSNYRASKNYFRGQ